MPDDRDLRSVLHSEAERHLPDRDAMLDRINQRRSSAPNRVMSLFRPVAPGPRRALNVLRPVAAAVAVAALLVAAVTGINVAGRNPSPGPQVAASPTAAAPKPSSPAPSSPAPFSSPPSSPASSSSASSSSASSSSASSSSAPGSRTGAPPRASGFLTASGTLNPYSIENWSQSDLVLVTTGTITALDVTVRIARTPQLRSTGRWTSVPTSLMTITESGTGKALVYRFTLNPGATLAPGHYTFAAQYNHAPGTRSLAADSYDATATAGTTAHVKGGYTE